MSQSLPDGGIGARDSSVSLELKSVPAEVSVVSGRLVYANTGSTTPKRTLVFLVDFTAAAPAGAYLLSCDSDPNWDTTVTATPMSISNPTAGVASSQESSSCVVRANSATAPDATLKFTLTQPGGGTLKFDLPVGLAH
jgi:hypothetical protein